MFWRGISSERYACNSEVWEIQAFIAFNKLTQGRGCLPKGGRWNPPSMAQTSRLPSTPFPSCMHPGVWTYRRVYAFILEREMGRIPVRGKQPLSAWTSGRRPATAVTCGQQVPVLADGLPARSLLRTRRLRLAAPHVKMGTGPAAGT